MEKKILEFKTTQDLITYAKEKALNRAVIKNKVISSTSGALLIMYKKSLNEVYNEILEELKEGNIVVVEKNENTLKLKKQK